VRCSGRLSTCLTMGKAWRIQWRCGLATARDLIPPRYALRRYWKQLHAPASVEACQNATPTANCAAADDFFDTALALDLKTGQIKWAKRLQGFDTWNLACFSPDRDKPELSGSYQPRL